MAQWMIGESYLHQKKYHDAIRAYLRGEGLYDFPKWQAVSLLQAGKCYEALGQWREAAIVCSAFAGASRDKTRRRGFAASACRTKTDNCVSKKLAKQFAFRSGERTTEMTKRPRNQWWTAAVLVALGGVACGTAPLLGQTPSDSSAEATAVAVNEPVTPVVEQNPIPTKNLLQVIRDGGPLMMPIGICSFALLVFVFERTIALRRGRVIPRPFVRRFLEQIREGQLDRDAAAELCENNGSPVAAVFAAAVNKWGRPAVEVEQAIIDEGERVTNGLRRYLRLFNGISTISPLLGLLGTVLGMIRAFNAIATADAMGRPELLAAGISQALLTTAAGLTVAIPALIAYLFFVGRVDRLIIDIDALGQQLVGLISAGARPRETTQSSKTKSRTKAA